METPADREWIYCVLASPLKPELMGVHMTTWAKLKEHLPGGRGEVIAYMSFLTLGPAVECYTQVVGSVPHIFMY
jgi:hypothetical protein